MSHATRFHGTSLRLRTLHDIDPSALKVLGDGANGNGDHILIGANQDIDLGGHPRLLALLLLVLLTMRLTNTTLRQVPTVERASTSPDSLDDYDAPEGSPAAWRDSGQHQTPSIDDFITNPEDTQDIPRPAERVRVTAAMAAAHLAQTVRSRAIGCPSCVV